MKTPQEQVAAFIKRRREITNNLEQLASHVVFLKATPREREIHKLICETLKLIFEHADR